jgi:hypothetical protein
LRLSLLSKLSHSDLFFRAIQTTPLSTYFGCGPNDSLAAGAVVQDARPGGQRTANSSQRHEKRKADIKTTGHFLRYYAENGRPGILKQKQLLLGSERMKTRFVINVGGSPRTAFAVHETQGGDLNIHITSGGRG